MKRPSYKDLQAKVRELQEIANRKVFPAAVPFETRDLLHFRIDRQWFFHVFDRKVCEFTGYAEEEFRDGRRAWLEVVHEEDRAAVEAAAQEGLGGDRYFSSVHRIVTGSGEVKWVKMRGSIFGEGEDWFLQGVMNDVTTQKLLELALQSEHEIFKWLADNLEDGIYIVSEDHRIVYMNQALVDLVGNRVGEKCYQALFGRDTICPWSVMNDIQHNTCGFQEYQMEHLGRVFQVRSFPLRTVDGSISKLGQLKDITLTKALKHEVLQFQNRHRAIEDAADSANLGIFLIQDHEGIEGRFRYANEAACRMTGYTSEELVGMSIAQLVPPQMVARVMDRYRRRQHGEQVESSYELSLQHKKGHTLIVLFSVATASFQDRIATVGFMRDLTHRKRAERSMWLSQRLASIGRLSAEIAHEINNPVTSILTFAKLIERIAGRCSESQERLPELRNFVALMAQEAERCAAIARNLLDFARQGAIEPRETNVQEILERTLDILRHRAQLQAVEITTFFAPDLPSLHCDFGRMQQAFMNILMNALEAMPDGGTLRVSTRFDSESRTIEVLVQDTGPGISEENLDRLFEPFFTTKEETKGVGLGLSVAYGVIRQHGGQIQVSNRMHQGTEFRIQLPIGNSRNSDRVLPGFAGHPPDLTDIQGER